MVRSKADGKGGQTIEDTGPLTKKRMETIDDETSAAALDFIPSEKVTEKTPFFCWFNSHAHALSHARQGREPRQVRTGRVRATAWSSTTFMSGLLLKKNR